MKFLFYTSLALILVSCQPSQRVVASWVNPNYKAVAPFNKIFVLAIASDNTTRLMMESRVGKVLVKRGKVVVRSSDLVPGSLAESGITQDKLQAIVKEQGCDGVFTVSLQDVQSSTYYVPGTSYSPYAYGYYGNYYGYYGYYSPQAYQPGYYQTEKTYYVETNFFDEHEDKLIWSIQSSATNPTNFDSWFNDYTRLIIYELRKEHLIK